MWHQHILDIENYYHDMILLCGHVIGHNPDGALDIEGKRARDEKTRQSLIEHFDGDVDGDIWGIQDKKSHEDNGTTAALNNLSSIPLNIIAENSYVTVNISFKKRDGVYFQAMTKSYKVKFTSPLNECFHDFPQHIYAMTREDAQLHGFRYINEYNIRSWVDGNSSPESLGIEPFGTIEVSFEVLKVRVDVYFGQNGDHSTYKVKIGDTLSTYLNDFAQSRDHSIDGYEFTHLGENIDVDYMPWGVGLWDWPFRILAVHSSDLAADKEVAGNNLIHIRIKDQSGEEIFFKVKRWMRMGKIFKVYCERKGVCNESLRFLLDGDEVPEYLSLYALELEDQDQIDAIFSQIGC
eukprot:scaffold28630_cov49-Cyclotella_meneghiniana.AAC.2